MAFLLRVELPDVPGSLGALASSIGAAGANIEAIEIVEHVADGTAIDDVMLDLPTGVLPDMVISACQKLEGIRVLWISRYTAGTSLTMDLEAVEALTAEPPAALSILVDLVPQTFRCDWAALVEGGSVVGTTSAAPDLDDRVLGGWLPLGKAKRLEPPAADQAWSTMELAGVPAGPGKVVLVGRRGGPEILDSELARLAHLAALAASVSEG
ncbi:MAG: amino acid-binding protein [Nocardioidaceae bacterium]